MAKETEIEKKLKKCEENLKEMRRLELMEQSVISGMREEGFSEKALKYFRYRENFLTNPLEYKADGVGFSNSDCGDWVEIYLKIGEDIIKDAKYTTEGCPGVIISASALTSQSIGASIYEAEELNVSSVVEYLREGQKGFPERMQGCCGIAVRALKDAINNYESIKKGRKNF